MTRLLLATVFTLGLCTGSAFAASDAEVRQLALSLQNSGAAVDGIGTSDFSVANEAVSFMTKQTAGVNMTDGMNDLAVSRLAAAARVDAPIHQDWHLPPNPGDGDLTPICGVAGCDSGEVGPPLLEEGPPVVMYPHDPVIDPCEGGGVCNNPGFGGVELSDDGDLGGFMPVLPITPPAPETGGGLMEPEPPLSMDLPMDGGMYTDGGVVGIVVP